MMYVWIVWGDEPIAVFSSEARARAYIAQHRAADLWSCRAACINPDSGSAGLAALAGSSACHAVAASASH